MDCRICGNPTRLRFMATVLRKYDVRYFHCNACGFIQTEQPYWLEEAYRRPINLSDTGLIQRNIECANKTETLLAYLFDSNGKILDFAGGYGVYTRLMRDKGFDCYWHDKYSQNLFAVGFEAQLDKGQFELVTGFEVFEHLPDPIEVIHEMLEYSKSVLFSTLLLPQPAPGPNEWWYYGCEHGQHISFYSLSSLRVIADRFGLNFYSDGVSLHLISEKRFPRTAFPLLLRLSRFGIAKFRSKNLIGRTLADSEEMRLVEGG